MWRVLPLKSVVTEQRESVNPAALGDQLVDHYSIPALDLTGKPEVVPAREIQSSKQSLKGGEVIVSRLNPRKARVHNVPDPHERIALASGEFIVMQPRHIEARFLKYCLLAESTRQYLDSRVQSVTRSHQRIRPEILMKLPISTPDLPQQQAIADYLDSETARIDALISKKRRLIQLLEEQWNSYIRGLLGSLACPMLPLKRHWRVIDCKHRTPTYVHNGYPVISPGDTIPGRLDLRRAHRFVDLTDFLDLTAGARRPKKGDIIYSRNASIGIASYVDTDVPFCMGQDVCLITSDDMEQLFLMYALNSIGLDQLAVQKIGSTFSRVNVSQILEILVPVPSRDELQTLSRRLDIAASHRARVCSRLEEQINLLQERRQALITAVVTGEMPVLGRGVTAASRSTLAQHTQIELVE